MMVAQNDFILLFADPLRYSQAEAHKCRKLFLVTSDMLRLTRFIRSRKIH